MPRESPFLESVRRTMRLRGYRIRCGAFVFGAHPYASPYGQPEAVPNRSWRCCRT